MHCSTSLNMKTWFSYSVKSQTSTSNHTWSSTFPNVCTMPTTTE